MNRYPGGHYQQYTHIMRLYIFICLGIVIHVDDDLHNYEC